MDGRRGDISGRPARRPAAVNGDPELNVEEFIDGEEYQRQVEPLAEAGPCRPPPSRTTVQ